MKNKKNIILLVALLIAILLSTVLFIGIGNMPKTSIQISAFIFVVLTEILLFTNIYIITNKKLNTFTIAGLSSTIFLYTSCSLIFNVLAISIFGTLKNILVFNISILLIYLLINTIIILFKKETNYEKSIEK